MSVSTLTILQTISYASIGLHEHKKKYVSMFLKLFHSIFEFQIIDKILSLWCISIAKLIIFISTPSKLIQQGFQNSSILSLIFFASANNLGCNSFKM